METRPAGSRTWPFPCAAADTKQGETYPSRQTSGVGGLRYLQDYTAAFPACTAGAKATPQVPCRFLSDFYLPFHTRKDHDAFETFRELK